MSLHVYDEHSGRGCRHTWRVFPRGRFIVVMVAAVVGCMSVAGSAPAAVPVVEPIAQSRFGAETPPGWELKGGWELTADGAVAEGACQATWDVKMPDSCLLEMIFELPGPEQSKDAVNVSFAIGPPGDGRITVSAKYTEANYLAELLGPGADGKPTKAAAKGSIQRHPRQLVSLGVAIGPERCRLLVNGSQVAEIAGRLPAQRQASLTAQGVTLKAVRLLPGIAGKYTIVSGRAMGMIYGAANAAPTAGLAAGSTETVALLLGGVPLVATGAGKEQLGTINVSAEQWKGRARTEGSGMLTAGIPVKRYSAAHILIFRPGYDPDIRIAALGFALRQTDTSTGELKNVYVADEPGRSSDEGVTVRPVPELGEGWFIARVPMNPAALEAQSLSLYLARPWVDGEGTPHPEGRPSALQVAAVTLEQAGIELSIDGNGLSNVYSEPEEPKLTGTLKNTTDAPLTVDVTTELMPYERKPVVKRQRIPLAPGEEKTFDALAAPVDERGHYRVRVVADAGPAGRIDYRTNIGLLAPDTRKKEDSPFGVWPSLSGQRASGQIGYLKEKAGVAFMYDSAFKHRLFGGRGSPVITDDATAEAVAKRIGPDQKWALFAWERKWGNAPAPFDVTYDFPRVIAEGKLEELPDEVNTKIDGVAEQLRLFAKAVRKLRPDVKISLGNTGVNWITPLLDRGIKYPEHFDYFGTEEGLFGKAPEQPNDGLGNVNWWARAICEHYGFKDVPLFHSESVYFATGPGFSRMSERDQAGYYVRTYLLGFPYDSIFGFSGCIVDSSSGYIYSIWGTSGYCNQGPECSPKLSYITYATLTELLDGVEYVGSLDTGTTTAYALQFKQRDGTPLYVVWNAKGARQATAKLTGEGQPQVIDGLNRPVDVHRADGDLSLVISDLPTYVKGVTIEKIVTGANVPEPLPQERTLISPIENASDWAVDAEPNPSFEKRRAWRGVYKVKGNFEVTDRQPPPALSEDVGKGAVTVIQRPLPERHGLIPRYVSLRVKPGKEISIPAGTTRLGIWVHGNSTWARVTFGLENADGKQWLVPNEDAWVTRVQEGFDGWRFLQTGYLGDEVRRGACKVNRILVTMGEKQVYVDELRTTERPQISLRGLHSVQTKPPAVNYLPW